ncbi:MAG: hypothetical protein L0226_14875 [Acidobacteria bacterium]|nr:hypothetical protein [Acidobacteriota bacterium]
MHCPNCGMETSKSQKYCRSCGMSLQIISQAVAEHLSEEGAKKSPDLLIDKKRQENFERWGKMIGACGLGMMILLLTTVFLCVVLDKIIGTNIVAFFDLIGPIVGPISFLLLIGGCGIFLYPHLKKEARGLLKRQTSQPETLPQAETTRELPAALQSEMVSVTEHTTRSLEPSSHDKPRAGE